MVISLQIPVLLFAQSDTSMHPSVGTIVAADVATVWRDAGTIFLAPLHFDGTAWAATGIVVAGTSALFAVDPPVRSLAMRNHSSGGDDVFDVTEQYGREVYGLAFSGGLYIGGLVFDNNEIRQTGLMVFESITFAGITTTVIKSLVGRSRPYVEDGPTRFKGMQFDNSYESLPSGHSTVAFAVSSVLAGTIKNTFASVGLYSLAALTAYSRVYHDEHWLSDAFLGAAIGTAVGMSVVRLHERRVGNTSFRISPSFDGLTITIQY